MTPVCDASTRPQSKQASNKRRAEREKKRIKAAVLRKELREDRIRLMHGSLPQAERDQLREDIKKKETACKSADTASTNFVPSDLAELLEHELEQSNAHVTNEINGVVNRVQVAEFQADSVMMHRAQKNQSVLMGTTDADMTILSGDGCIGLNEFMQEGRMTLQCTCKKTLCNAMKYIQDDIEDGDCDAQFVEAR